MGCDIHCYMEFRERGRDYWQDFGGRINPGRNYTMFGYLAGVRDHTVSPVVAPRGLPSDPGYYSKNDNQIYITADGGDDYCTPAEAARYVAGGCHYIASNDNPQCWVTHPDWHTHSWLTPAELEKAIAGAASHMRGVGPEYGAVLCVLKYFESLGYEARLVFWFDN